MGIFSFVKPGKQIFKTISSVTPKVNKTKLDKAKSKLAIATQQTKASTAKLGQTIFESKNKDFKGKDFTFATKKGKSESNKEAYKRIQGENTKVIKGMIDKAVEKKADGGRIGRRLGGGADMAKRKTNVEKIKETFAPKNKNLKTVDKKKQKGLAKLPIEVRNKMGYAKKGGRA